MKHLFLILAFLLFAGCSSDDDEMNNGNAVVPILISKGVVFNGAYNPAQHERVFRNDAEWTDFKNYVWQLAVYPPEADVDFTTHMVVAVFDQARATGGYEVNVSSVHETPTQIVVDVVYSGNGDATQMPTRPYYFFKIPNSSKPVVFQ